MKQQWHLSDLNPGESALVKKSKITGSMRRRMLDIGLIPQAPVTCLSRSPGGDPCAYLIRGAVIAIREKDASLIEILPKEDSPADTERLIALAGNPNVGKSTVFNNLTGMKQHTGNWPGKTVSSAWGRCSFDGRSFLFADIPGTYSLMAHSAEEEVARNLICFGEPDTVVVVCDATCLERSLNLVLQILEVTKRAIVCVNLMDEAKRKGICVDLNVLEQELKVPVIGVTARKKKTLTPLLQAVANPPKAPGLRITYEQPIEDAVSRLEPLISSKPLKNLPARWVSLKLLEDDPDLIQEIHTYLNLDLSADPKIRTLKEELQRSLRQTGLHREAFKDQMVSSLLHRAENICQKAVLFQQKDYQQRDRDLDAVFTSKWTGYPFMLLLLAFLFWLTIVGANFPSRLLSSLLFGFQEQLTRLFAFLHAPAWLHGALVLGVYRVLAWVVSVMLPPMAIFFPLFTLLEDLGYLPRIAYNLDRCFQCCRACGKQALTMCMGFGCNAVGVTGCRIIDSQRERLLALLTNSFVPCNGRFPALIALLSMFFAGNAGSKGNNFFSSLKIALLLTGTILLSVGMTFLVTRFLSCTLLKGAPSSFILELPPYRRPQAGQILLRSLLSRTLFVLGRAVCVAAPAGLFIWILANCQINGISLLTRCAAWLDPFARFLGLDGTILLAFFLGFPANEIVIPIMLMAYTAQGTLVELGTLPELKALLLSQGWTFVTALCTLLLFLFHWPCSTTLWTIKKETGSWKWTLLALLLPTAAGFLLCALVSHGAALFL